MGNPTGAEGMMDPDRNCGDEHGLVSRARRGDLEAFGALVTLYQERAVRLAFSLLGSWEDARDAAQEAFVKAYQSMGSFREESLFSTWFYRILINHCHDWRRRSQVRRHLAAEGGSTREEAESGADALTTASSRESPAEESLRAELEERIRADLAELPERQKMVFTLRYFEGLTLHEIASALSLSEGAVKAHLWHAGGKIKKNLKRYLEIKEVRR
ncbi:MAG: sigma-70 family RNA polymerase sigma factor [Candidatus Omnitrophica bacterium]|nr:sigma-70 family RNA polymerase sigma factor [Candidatus Omnitrophota bacterium]